MVSNITGKQNVLKVQQAELIENSAKEREKVILILQCYILRCRL
jgi:hypothetical protein